MLSHEIKVPYLPDARLVSNYISTTKYSLLTFLPFALLIQFKRYANIYFLFGAILQSIPQISPLSPLTAIAPLIFVLSLSMFREGFEELKRYRSDCSDNEQEAHRLHETELVSCHWKDLRSGDLVRVTRDQLIPIDFILLLSSSASGLAYVETSSLDGEKNLKPKTAEPNFQLQFNSVKKLPNFRFMQATIKSTLPSSIPDAFRATVSLYIDGNSSQFQCEAKQMLLRGCRLKNTDWVVGLAVFAGLQTTIMQNNTPLITKISSVQSRLNGMILIILIFEVLCCFSSTLLNYFSCQKNPKFTSLLNNGMINCAFSAATAFGSYLVLYNTFIPISLIVSLEFVKVFQGFLMEKDRQMYTIQNNQHARCQTVSINDELGRIDYVLTDKTGTLTCNQMVFKNIVIADTMYGEDIPLQAIFPKFDFSRLSHKFEASPTTIDGHFESPVLQNDIMDKKQLVNLMFMIITTCHECLRSLSTEQGFQGTSPDEVALLQASLSLGFQFISNQNRIITLRLSDALTTFQILKMYPFDATRKRMSIVLRSADQCYVFVKGADSTLLPLLCANEPYLQSITKKTKQMAQRGLRSLWFGYKMIDATVPVDDIKKIESDLHLVGATGIEDRLQDYVAETIFALREAGMKFVMLTGDKLETAENIATSCRLIEQGIIVSDETGLQKCVKSIKAQELVGLKISKSPIIQGSLLNNLEYREMLSLVLLKSPSAVFCRMTPTQKAQIVRMLREAGMITMAVGDGSNDVNMLVEANVGVGIFGQQGTRAVQVANFAIGQFCLLWKLTLYYGRLNYMRISQLVLYFFYKNVIFTIIQFAYSFLSGGSGQSFWLSWPITLYNTIFTLLPVVIKAVFEVDVALSLEKETFRHLREGMHTEQTLYSYYPRLYLTNKSLFTGRTFLVWFVMALMQGVICLMIVVYGFQDSVPFQYGLYFEEVAAYTSVLVVVTLKLALNIKQWNAVLWIGFLVPSLGAYIVYIMITNYLQTALTFAANTDLFTNLQYYIVTFVAVIGMFTVDLFVFSLEATKINFQNYFKFRSINRRRLQTVKLKEYAVELMQKF